MEGFGQALRHQRMAAGMRQQDLVDALDRVIARSTLANVEVGRENPSARLWAAINQKLPEWVPHLEPWYRRDGRPGSLPPFELSGPYEILEATYAYTFRDHRAPEEILLVRRVRALVDGCDGYGLQLSNNSGTFDLDTEALWGGWIQQHERRLAEDRSAHLTRFHFDRRLQRGEVHEFCTRSWVSHDDPGDTLLVKFTRPTHRVNLSLNFLGPRPRHVWAVGPVTDPDDPSVEVLDPRRSITSHPNGTCAASLDEPLLGRFHGISWKW